MTNPGDTSATFCATLADEWTRAGVIHAVVSPGSRSTPLAVALAAHPGIEVHLFHDERSAGFAALGIGRESGFPAVLLCTSGTAAAHFTAAVHEANLSRIPMIVCTADRPPELKDVSAPQTIDQTMLYGGAVRWFHDPGVPADDARHTWRSLARRAVASSTGTLPGPVHLNLPFREPLLGRAGDLPPATDAVPARAVLGVDHESAEQFISMVSGKRGVIVAGRGADNLVLKFASAVGWPVLADSTSGLRQGHGDVVMAFDPILRSTKFSESHMPEVVVRVGDLPASKVLAQWVGRSGAPVIQVVDHEAPVDPDHSVALYVIAPLEELAMQTENLPERCGPGWVEDWVAAEAAAQQAISGATRQGLSEIAVARAVTEACAGVANLVVSSSMPIRDVEWYGSATEMSRVFANRGANGIDGVVSTAVGVALSSNGRTVVYLGDLALVHDSNGLWGLMRRDVDLTVVVSNNDGGSIFSFLPQAAQVDTDTFELLYGTPHGVDFAALAAAHGVPHVLAGSAEEVRRLVGTPGTKIVEVRTDRSVNVAEHDRVNAAVVAAVEAATA